MWQDCLVTACGCVQGVPLSLCATCQPCAEADKRNKKKKKVDAADQSQQQQQQEPEVFVGLFRDTAATQ
jgi:hypothetical protein